MIYCDCHVIFCIINIQEYWVLLVRLMYPFAAERLNNGMLSNEGMQPLC